MALAFLVNGIVPCAIGVGAGTPKLGAFGVGPVEQRVRPFFVVLLKGLRCRERALSRARGLGKGLVLTFHAPRQNKRKQADSSSPQLNALLQVVEVLKMLGCSQDILDMVKSKVDEQTKAQHQVPGEKERMLHVLKMKLTKAKSHLAHLQSVEKKKEEEYAHARDLAIEQARYLVEIQNQHDQAFQRVIEGSVVDSATSEGPGLEEISDDEAQLQAMSDDDPDLAPKEWAQPEKATDVALSPPPPPKFPRVLPAKIECTDAERAQVQAWDINSVQAMHNWCQERLAAACQATPEG